MARKYHYGRGKRNLYWCPCGNKRIKFSGRILFTKPPLSKFTCLDCGFSISELAVEGHKNRTRGHFLKYKKEWKGWNDESKN